MTIKVRQEVLELVEEMIRLGLARSRNQAFNMIIEMGLSEAANLVRRKRAVEKLVREYMERGLPYEDLPTASDVEEERRDNIY